ncbi:MAG: hypothetical protein N2444_02580, partial [Methylocystis sp.]|nr:hypothetical protein [Methylocystis sp.]
ASADHSKLVRTLSRERGKDMASDYRPAQQFAERRKITFRERIVDIARQLPERRFAGRYPAVVIPSRRHCPHDARKLALARAHGRADGRRILAVRRRRTDDAK